MEKLKNTMASYLQISKGIDKIKIVDPESKPTPLDTIFGGNDYADYSDLAKYANREIEDVKYSYCNADGGIVATILLARKEQYSDKKKGE